MKPDKRRALTPKKIKAAYRLRSDDIGWTEISARLHCSYDLLRRAIDPEYAERRNANVRLARLRGRGTLMSKSVPQSVLDDRARRQQVTPTITGRVFGDPPPGYSELDRKNQTPIIIAATEAMIP